MANFGEPLVRACYAEVTAGRRGAEPRASRRSPGARKYPGRPAALRADRSNARGRAARELGSVPRIRADGRGADRRGTGPSLVLHGHSGTAAPSRGGDRQRAGLQRRRPRDQPRLLGLRPGGARPHGRPARQRRGWRARSRRPWTSQRRSRSRSSSIEEDALPLAERGARRPRTGIDSPAEPSSIDMQWEWPLGRPPCPPRTRSRCACPSRRGRSTCRAGRACGSSSVKSSRKPDSNSLTRTQQVVCGE